MTTFKKTLLSARNFLRVNVIVPMLIAVTEAQAAVYGGGGVQEGINQASGLGGISNSTSVKDVIIRIINFILDLVLLLAVAAVIIAGIYLITSNGEKGQKDKAKKIIYYALIGVVVVLFSRTIVLLVNNLFS